MRVLAIDHGTRRMGIAISDELRTIAQPLEYIPAAPFAAFLTRLRELLIEKNVDLIVVGMPRNMDGTFGPASDKVNAFIALVSEFVDAGKITKTAGDKLTSGAYDLLVSLT